MLRRVLTLAVMAGFVLVLCERIGLAAEPRKPAVLFLSGNLPRFYGGGYLRMNMARVANEGYRVAYFSYSDFLGGKKSDLIQSFDVVVLMTMPDITQDVLKTEVPAMFAELRNLLQAGGGVMVFPQSGPTYRKAFEELVSDYGLWTMSGCVVDDAPIKALYGTNDFAPTTRITKHPLTEGVKGLWYPVGAKAGGEVNYDTLRNANTYLVGVNENWTTLASLGPSSSFKAYGASEVHGDTWALEPHRRKMFTEPAPLVAVREGVEGAGRMAVCAIDYVYSDFCAGNKVFKGVCTGEGLEGKPSDLNALLMNVLDWLGQASQEAGRDTIDASIEASYQLEPYRWPSPETDVKKPLLESVHDQFVGLVGVRSDYSGGQSSIAEYAAVARELGIQYLAFLEDFDVVDRDEFDAFQKECAKHSDDQVMLLPGIHVQDIHGVHYFGFRAGLTLPSKVQLVPDTRRFNIDHRQPQMHHWAVINGHRPKLACGNFCIDEPLPAGIPPSDYQSLNPFVSIFTYRNGRLVHSMVDTFLKCAGRSELVSPITVNLIDSADALRKEWNSDHFRTVWLMPKGEGLAGFKGEFAEGAASGPVTYVTNGPRIEVWRSSGNSCSGEWFDWTRLRLFQKMAVSSEVGLEEIRVMDGQRLIRRFLPGGAKRFEHTMTLTFNKMQNLVLIVTDVEGRQAFSDECWSKNQILYMDMCSDRCNTLGDSRLPAPKASSGSMAGNWPLPFSMDKGGFRETLSPRVNLDQMRMPGFDGQAHGNVNVYPCVTFTCEGSYRTLRSLEKGGIPKGKAGECLSRSSRDHGRLVVAPDAAIQTASFRLVYHKSIDRAHPRTRGPLVPMKYFNADLRYITFSHHGHYPAPVILEGKIKLLKDVSFDEDGLPLSIRVLTMCTSRPWAGYDTAVIKHAAAGNLETEISYDANEPTPTSFGPFTPGSYGYFYPSTFGSVGVMSFHEGLSFQYQNKFFVVGYDARGQTLKAGQELSYRILVFVAGFDEPANTRLPEAIRSHLGMNENGEVSYTVEVENGEVVSKQYVLKFDGKGVGFAGRIDLPEGFPVSLPITVDNLNDRWTSVLYDRNAKRFRPLAMVENTAYCHRAPFDRTGNLFIGHPFTLDCPDVWITVVQTRDHELTVQIHNPTDGARTANIKRTPAFDFIECDNFTVKLGAGQTREYRITPRGVEAVSPENRNSLNLTGFRPVAITRLKGLLPVVLPQDRLSVP